jgi:DNA repair protein RecO (recombination protein O)
MLYRILSSKRGKLNTSYFQPLTLLELEAVHKDKGSLERIKEAKVIHPYRTLHVNMIKSTMVIFLAEVIKNSIREEEKNLDLFKFLENSLIWLDDHEQIANFHILFLLKLSKYLGFYPDQTNINRSHFNLLEGIFQDSKTNDYCEEGLSVQALKQFFGTDFDEISGIKLTKATRFETLNLLLNYYKLHLHNFKNPRSLLVLKQLFEHL